MSPFLLNLADVKVYQLTSPLPFEFHSDVSLFPGELYVFEKNTTFVCFLWLPIFVEGKPTT